MEHAGGDQAGEGCGENVASVENSDTGSDLGTRVEVRNEEKSTGVVRSFSASEEEADGAELAEILGERRADREDRPGEHNETEVERGLDTGDEHVRGDTKDDITGEKNRDGSLVLHVGHLEVLDKSGDWLSVVVRNEGAECGSACRGDATAMVGHRGIVEIECDEDAEGRLVIAGGGDTIGMIGTRHSRDREKHSRLARAMAFRSR